MSSVSVMQVCGELDEGVFDIRRSLPLGWMGPAAENFTARAEAAAHELSAVSKGLRHTAGLIQVHEQRMHALRVAMGSGG